MVQLDLDIYIHSVFIFEVTHQFKITSKPLKLKTELLSALSHFSSYEFECTGQTSTAPLYSTFDIWMSKELHRPVLLILIFAKTAFVV